MLNHQVKMKLSFSAWSKSELYSSMLSLEMSEKTDQTEPIRCNTAHVDNSDRTPKQ